MTPSLIALYDASVLYPAPLRSFLMYLATEGMFRARWTDAIHDEWTRSLRRDRPDIPEGKIAQVRQLMDANVLDCLVAGYEKLIPTLALPDLDDRHVLAAGIHAKADVIVTRNLRHFPKSTLAQYAIEAVHPDDFIVSLLKDAPSLVFSAAKRHRSSLKNPAMDADAFLRLLERQGLSKSVALLRTDEASI
jgi:hypothetical protein